MARATEILLVLVFGAAEHRAEQLAEHGESGLGEDRFHLAREHDECRHAARRVETRDVARNEDTDFSGDHRDRLHNSASPLVRKGEREGRAAARSLRHADRPAVRLDQFARNGEAEPGAGRRLVLAPEGLEHPLAVGLDHPLAMVRDFDRRARADANHHGFAAWLGGQRIVDQIADDALERATVAADRRPLALRLELHVGPIADRDERIMVDDALGERDEIDLLLEHAFAFAETRVD
ncbi:hypothetical protein [Methylosinus sp. LW3]|uniref:hypothetical protein n=1 Tax=Methylosinus sp. LW3 TaxID=107635 RepID=UPI0012F864B6|nr:hypothetical protein [Methylosinus sp. LW3]